MTLDREELKKLLKEKGVKSPDDFNAFRREVSKEVVEKYLDCSNPRGGFARIRRPRYGLEPISPSLPN